MIDPLDERAVTLGGVVWKHLLSDALPQVLYCLVCLLARLLKGHRRLAITVLVNQGVEHLVAYEQITLANCDDLFCYLTGEHLVSLGWLHS